MSTGLSMMASYLLEATLITAHPEAQLFVFRADDRRLGGYHGAVGVVQKNGECIFVGRSVGGAGGANEACHTLGQTEEMHGLIKEVSAEIVNGRATGDDLVLPGVGIGSGFFGTVAVEVCFVFGDAAERAVLHELGEGDEVGVPAAVWFVSYEYGNARGGDVLWKTASCLLFFFAMATSSSASWVVGVKGFSQTTVLVSF